MCIYLAFIWPKNTILSLKNWIILFQKPCLPISTASCLYNPNTAPVSSLYIKLSNWSLSFSTKMHCLATFKPYEVLTGLIIVSTGYMGCYHLFCIGYFKSLIAFTLQLWQILSVQLLLEIKRYFKDSFFFFIKECFGVISRYLVEPFFKWLTTKGVLSSEEDLKRMWINLWSS